VVVVQQLINGLILGSVYALFAIGLSLVWGILKILNMAHAAIFTWGATAAYFLLIWLPLPLFVLVPAIMLFTGVLAAVVDFFAFRPVRKQQRNPDDAELATLVTSLGAAAVLLAIDVKLTNNGAVLAYPDSLFTVQRYTVAGITLSNLQISMFVLAIVLSLGAAAFIKWNRTGKAMRAIAVNPDMAAMLGVNVDRLTIATIAVGGALAGAAGVLLGVAFHAIHSEMGDPLLLKAFAITILGSAGSVTGALVGGLLLGVIEASVLTFASASYRDAVSFGLIVLVLLLRPNGLFAIATGQRV
jgi:branched-chain amino acid transport system permease protein